MVIPKLMFEFVLCKLNQVKYKGLYRVKKYLLNVSLTANDICTPSAIITYMKNWLVPRNSLIYRIFKFMYCNVRRTLSYQTASCPSFFNIDRFLQIFFPIYSEIVFFIWRICSRIDRSNLEKPNVWVMILASMLWKHVWTGNDFSKNVIDWKTQNHQSLLC